MRRLLHSLGAACLLLTASAACAEPKLVHVGTGSAGGIYYPAGGAICRLVNRGKNDHGLRCQAESTTGSLANLNALRTGELQFAVVQSNWQDQAYHGTGLFEGKAFADLRTVFSLYSEPFLVLVRADAPITSFEEIRGKRINAGTEDSSLRPMLEDIFAPLGWKLADFPAAALRWEEQSDALCKGEIDVAFYVFGQPNALMQEATTRCPTRILPIEGALADKILARAPYLTRTSVPGGMYAGNPNEVRSLGVRATLVTTSEVESATVHTLVEAVFGHLVNFKTMHPVFAGLNAKAMAQQGLTAPLHDGAQDYYEENGFLPKPDAK